MTAFTTSSLTSPPLENTEHAIFPNSVPALHSARKTSPVEMAGMPKRCDINSACVPLPQPGGPKSRMITRPPERSMRQFQDHLVLFDTVGRRPGECRRSLRESALQCG